MPARSTPACVMACSASATESSGDAGKRRLASAIRNKFIRSVNFSPFAITLEWGSSLGRGSSVNPWEKYLVLLFGFLAAAVLFKIAVSGLLRTYYLLAIFLAVDLVQSVAGELIPYRSNRYAEAYFCFQTLKIAIGAFMLINIYSLALERQPALARFGRNAVGYALAAAAFLPFIGFMMDRSLTTGKYPTLRAFFLFEQTMDGTIGIFLILIAALIAWFAVPIRRNLMVYLGGFILWSLSHSALVHAVNRGFDNKQFKQAADIMQTAVGVACLLFWLFGFRRSGESQTVVVAPLRSLADATLLTERLAAINTRVEQLARL
jgi:hypothetical protein